MLIWFDICMYIFNLYTWLVKLISDVPGSYLRILVLNFQLKKWVDDNQMYLLCLAPFIQRK